MYPEKMVLEKAASPKNFDELMDELETGFRFAHEQTTLESICLQPDATVQTPGGVLQVTRDFLEACADIIGMPRAYAHKISPELFCENFRRRQAETTAPVTVCTVGEVATGLVNDRKSRYRPACTREVLRSLRQAHDFEFRRASVSFSCTLGL